MVGSHQAGVRTRESTQTSECPAQSVEDRDLIKRSWNRNNDAGQQKRRGNGILVIFFESSPTARNDDSPDKRNEAVSAVTTNV
jgi:hypothetical protein